MCDLQNSATFNCVLFMNICMYIHRTKLTESNEKATDEGLLVMESTRCMSIILYSLYVYIAMNKIIRSSSYIHTI